jgi:hypothetical protein
MAERMLRRLRHEMCFRILRFPNAQFERVSSGELVSAVTAEVEPLGGVIGDGLLVGTRNLAGIAGSATIGSRCMIGGGVGVAGHITICDGTIVGGMSLVERSVAEPGFYTGAWPLQGHTQWERTAATLKQLPQLRQRLRALASLVGLPKDPS